MKMLVLLSLFTSVAMSCGDGAYRCVNPDDTPAQNWERTKTCMDKVGGSDCWCYHWAEYYVDVGDNVQAFQDCCSGFDGYSSREC
jgi:hypothetical protein